MSSIWGELKRRNVIKVAVAYGIVSWLLLEVSSVLGPALRLPEWSDSLVAFLVILGFPIALILSWAYEMTPEGIKLEKDVDRSKSTMHLTGRKLDFFIIAALSLALVFVVIDQYILEETIEPDVADELSRDSGPAVAEERRGVLHNSVAVLPFENLSPNPDNAYFAAGIHEEILNQLGKISAIQVTSRTTVLSYADSDLSTVEIARELSVGSVMEGSVRFADNRVRITLQLIDAMDDVHLWSETYTRELDDIFAIETDVALEVANAMQATLSPDEIASIERPMTENSEALLLYLQTRYQYEQENARDTLAEDGWVEAGIPRLEQAIELDPMFARGLAELGFFKYFKGSVQLTEEREALFDEAIIYASRAIEIDPTISRAFVVLQRVANRRRQWDDWKRYADQSVELPDLDGRAALSYAVTLAQIGQFEEAYRWYDEAITKNPGLVFYREFALVARIGGRDYETALTMAEEYRAVGGDKNVYHIIRAFAFYRLRRQAESDIELGEMTPAPLVAGMARDIKGLLDYMRCQSGDQDRVMEEIQGLAARGEREIRTRHCAAGAGDIDAIFASYRRLITIKVGWVYRDLILDEIRADPRWQEIEDYMDLPTTN